MNQAELKNQIVTSNLGNFYIFVGEEIEAINIYMRAIMDSSQLFDLIRCETVSEAWNITQRDGFIPQPPAIYVVRGDNSFLKEEKEWQKVIETIGDNILILLYDKLDSRQKFAKTMKEYIVTFNPMSIETITMYIMRDTSLSKPVAEKLVSRCGGSYDICLREIEKASNLGKVTDKLIDKLIESGDVASLIETSVFDFINYVCEGNIHDSYAALDNLMANNVSTFSILSLLYNNLRAIMLMQCCNGNDYANITGLDNGIIYHNRGRLNVYDTGVLLDTISLIKDITIGIKLGKYKESHTVETILLYLYTKSVFLA